MNLNDCLAEQATEIFGTYDSIAVHYLHSEYSLCARELGLKVVERIFFNICRN